MTQPPQQPPTQVFAQQRRSGCGTLLVALLVLAIITAIVIFLSAFGLLGWISANDRSADRVRAPIPSANRQWRRALHTARARFPHAAHSLVPTSPHTGLGCRNPVRRPLVVAIALSAGPWFEPDSS
jgi:hypothetical protein